MEIPVPLSFFLLVRMSLPFLVRRQFYDDCMFCDGALMAVRWLILAMESSSFRFGETCQYILGQEEYRADRG